MGHSIIEAYTFNFSVSDVSTRPHNLLYGLISDPQYCEVPGTTEVVPVMTLGDEMMNLSLSGSRQVQDPVAEATKKGKVPTLGEVKRSLKVRGSISHYHQALIASRLSSRT